MKGLEPSWIAPLEPKPSAYTNSATSTGHYTYPYACCGAIKPNILTVCNGVGQGSTLNIQRGLIPNYRVSVYPNRWAPLVGTSQVPNSSTWTRTRNPLINSQMLCRLGYRGPNYLNLISSLSKTQSFRLSVSANENANVVLNSCVLTFGELPICCQCAGIKTPQFGT